MTPLHELMANKASFSLLNVTYAAELPNFPSAVRIASLLTIILRIVPYWPKYSTLLRTASDEISVERPDAYTTCFWIILVSNRSCFVWASNIVGAGLGRFAETRDALVLVAILVDWTSMIFGVSVYFALHPGHRLLSDSRIFFQQKAQTYKERESIWIFFDTFTKKRKLKVSCNHL